MGQFNDTGGEGIEEKPVVEDEEERGDDDNEEEEDDDDNPTEDPWRERGDLAAAAHASMPSW